MTAAEPDSARLIAALPLAVVLVGPDGQIVRVNPMAEHLLGQSQRRLGGMALETALQFDEARLVVQNAPVSARDTGVTIRGQGKRRLDVSLTPMGEDAGWTMFCFADATPSDVRGEGAGQGDSTMLRGPEILAHEIKNPLAGIRGAAQLLGRKLDEAGQGLTQLITDEVDRIAKLIDQMQNLSRQTIAPVAPCNLHEVVRRAMAVVTAADGGLRIEEAFDPSLPQVLGDDDGLVQVLINLLTNAREAMTDRHAGQIVIRTRFASGMQYHATDKGKPVRLQIELRVSDNGPGIDPAIRDHVFDPFVTSKSSGQGLGLALVRKLVRDMHGRISHDRDEAKGWTHFHIYLPMAKEGAKP